MRPGENEPMTMISKHSEVAAAVEDVFAWHERPGAVERLLPPWEPVRVQREAPSLQPGNRAVLRTAAPGPLVGRWVAEHTGYDPPREFRDVQVSGPFAGFEHRHRFEPAGAGRTRVSDEISYRLPLHGLTAPAAGGWAQRRLARMLSYRHRVLADDLAAHEAARARGADRLHVAMTGASGLIGSALAALLSTGGHRVTRLVRRAPAGPDEIRWSPQDGEIDTTGLARADAVVHLAGASIGGPWTEQHKRRIRNSRVQGTKLLARTLAELDDGPSVLVCGSAVGYYGAEHDGQPHTEDSGSGGGFLAGVCRDWEAAADPARQAGLRVVHVRTGVVQTPRGGSLQLQLPLFAAGLGGRLGSGRQCLSWIGLDDIIGIFHHALTSPVLHGAVNGTAPEPVSNAEYTRVLGRVLGRPAVLPVPQTAPKALLGAQGARETALADQHVLPERTLGSGYRFRHPDLEAALRHLLGRT